MERHDDPRLTRLQRLLVVLFFALFVGFGVLVEIRSAFLTRRMGDVGVYFRAAWAVRSGVDLYAITDDNEWHYNYPPLFAILLMPLADPPAGEVLPGTLPYPALVAIFYLLSAAALFGGVHLLASALESRQDYPPTPFSQRWWLLRLVPMLVCLPPIGHTLMRGQANLFVLALICGFIAMLLRGRHLQSGWFLAAAICLKIFPAFLFIYPLWRRDWRCLVGCGQGLIVGLTLIPLAAMGPARTYQCYASLAEGLVKPALGSGGDNVRDDELIKVTRNDSQSFQAVLHKTIYLDPTTRPERVSDAVRWTHRALGLICTLFTLFCARWRAQADGVGTCLFVGSLTFLMIILSPVCHTHYFALCVPLVMGLMMAKRGMTGLVFFFGLFALGNTLPLLPAFEVLKDTGSALYVGLALWLAGCTVLRASTKEQMPTAEALKLAA